MSIIEKINKGIKFNQKQDNKMKRYFVEKYDQEFLI